MQKLTPPLTGPFLVSQAPRDIATQRRAIQVRGLLGPLVSSLLREEDVTDIMRNEDGILRATRFGEPTRVVGQMSDRDADALIAAVASTHGTSVTAEKPGIEGELVGGGERFTGLVPPVVVSPVFAIRKPASQVFPLADYVRKAVLTERQAALLEQAVVNHKNIAVVGGTGAGKSTLLNALLEAGGRLTPQDRVAVIEQLRELQCPFADRVMLRLTDTFDEQAAIRKALRLFINRIIVGEVRGPEALAMLMAWNTGHDGGFCTFHARTSSPTPRAALERIEQMVALATPAAMQRTIGSAIDLIVCLERRADGIRRVSQIATVHGWDDARNDYRLNLEGC